MENEPLLHARISAVIARLKEWHWRLTTAESCTGGLLAKCLTDVAGSSAVFDCGFVCYSNASKIRLLGVQPRLIDLHGAVSAEVAAAMAQGALAHSEAHLSVAITGIAGPEGGTSAKPVGTVFLAAALRSGSCQAMHHRIAGDRGTVRAAAALIALELVGAMLEGRQKDD